MKRLVCLLIFPLAAAALADGHEATPEAPQGDASMGIQVHFWTGDVAKMLKHYQEVLGFELEYSQPEGGPPNFGILKLGAAQIMFGEDPVSPASERKDQELMKLVTQRVGTPGPVSIYVAVPDAARHHEALAARGADIREPAWSTPWGLTQFSVLDPDGNILTFHSSAGGS